MGLERHIPAVFDRAVTSRVVGTCLLSVEPIELPPAGLIGPSFIVTSHAAVILRTGMSHRHVLRTCACMCVRA